MQYKSINDIKREITQCITCIGALPFPPKPMVQINTQARLLIIGQAPSLTVQKTGILWNDASGRRLTEWLGITIEQLHDETQVAILPIGFCYPGKNQSGDLPPRKECAPLWHDTLYSFLGNVELILLVGQHAQQFYLKEHCKKTLTETVQNWKSYLPKFIPLPHPSPRNNIWLRRNPWFETEVIPLTKELIANILLK